MNFYRLTMRHFGWKATSVLIATVLWVAIRWDMIQESRKEARGGGLLVTREYNNVPIIVWKRAAETNQFILEPAVARVKVKANSVLLEETSIDAIRVSANLTKLPATNRFRIALELQVPDEIEVEFLEPREAEVRTLGRE